MGILLAVHDGAEVILKPVFGTLADRIGPRPVLLGGLAAFAAAPAMFVVVGNPALLVVVSFAQGAAASAFSPAAGAMVARLSHGSWHGRVFGSYGALAVVLGGVALINARHVRRRSTKQSFPQGRPGSPVFRVGPAPEPPRMATGRCHHT